MVYAPGTQLGRFRIERPLGKGAAGVVYLATDTTLKQPVALKVLHAFLAEDHEVLERFKREIVLSRRVSHPGVCRVHDLHEHEGEQFVSMEYVEGKTLAALIHEKKRLSPRDTLDVLRSLAPPLIAAHAVGVVHRDLKPGNVLVRPDGSVAVLDFGMATSDDVQRITRAGRTVGSLRFIAPEVWAGEPATAASDQYALGVVLYACLAGRLPSDASSPMEAFRAQQSEVPSLVRLNPRVSSQLESVVLRAMARKPGDRFLDVAELLAAFEDAVAVLPPSTDEVTATHHPAPHHMAAPVSVPSADVALFVDASTSLVDRRARDTGEHDPVRGMDDGPTLARPHPGLPAPLQDRRVWIAGGAALALLLVLALVGFVGDDDDDERAPPVTTVAPPARPRVDAPAGPADDALARRGRAEPMADPLPDPSAEENVGADVAAQLETEAAVASGAAPAKAKASTAARATLAGVMKKRGLRAGDVPAVDALVAKARALDKAGRADDAAAALERARVAASRVVIDRGFVTAKQKRLRFAGERAAATTRGAVGALEAEAEARVLARDYAGANEKLNRGFALLK